MEKYLCEAIHLTFQCNFNIFFPINSKFLIYSKKLSHVIIHCIYIKSLSKTHMIRKRNIKHLLFYIKIKKYNNTVARDKTCYNIENLVRLYRVEQ